MVLVVVWLISLMDLVVDVVDFGVFLFVVEIVEFGLIYLDVVVFGVFDDCSCEFFDVVVEEWSVWVVVV